MQEPQATGVERVDWEDFWRQEGGFKPGQHLSVVGPTGTGKTYTLIWFAEQFDGHSILVVTKGDDEMIERLERERGWTIVRDVDDIFTAQGRPGRLLRKSLGDRWEKRERPAQRIVYWPRVDTTNLELRAERLQAALQALVDRAYEYCRSARSHRCFIGIDETAFAAMELGMNRRFTIVWNEGRSMRLSLGAAMQRTAWISKSARSAPSYVIVFGTSDPDDLADLAKLAGYYRRTGEFREIFDDLDEHEHLLIPTRGRGAKPVRSRVVIRKRRAVE
jgi:hypothetical protein